MIVFKYEFVQHRSSDTKMDKCLPAVRCVCPLEGLHDQMILQYQIFQKAMLLSKIH